jgi:4-hydroxy-tetrahydrodipicolinate reductase
MRLRVCVAGATGWVGKPLCRAISEADDLSLVGAVSRTRKGQKLKDAIGDLNLDMTVSG